MVIGTVTLVVVTVGVGWMMLYPKSPASRPDSMVTATPAPAGVKPAAFSVTVAPGETMQTLLRHYGLPETSDEVGLVQALNPRLGTSDTIHAGQVLLVPAPATPPAAVPAPGP